MDPCPFVRVLVGNLSLKLPSSSSSSSPRPSPAAAGGGVGVHPSAAPCFCKIRLNNLPYQTSSLPLGVAEPSTTSQTLTLAAAFHLSPSDLLKLSASSIFPSKSRIKIAIYTGRRGSTCGVSSGKLLGKVAVPVDLAGADARPALHHNGWATVGKKASGAASLHLTVRSEPDPRFVFEFGGEPECSPQVFQVQGARKQPVFTCKFTCRSSSSADLRSRSLPLDSSISRGCLSSFGSDRERPSKERKGWSVTVHDLSGSPVALASMVTPFVASPGTDRVSRSNPGAWLVLRPGEGTWKPWARLEAWRERGAGSADGLGYRFDLLPDATMASSSGVSIAESTLSTAKGGKFAIDLTGSNAAVQRVGNSPGCSPRRGSGDFGFGLWPFANYKGFVMSSTVEGEGKCSRPVVEVGVQQVGCTEDAAAFVALAAAIDLSMDACKLFSHKLRKELWQQLEGSGRGLFA